MRNIKYRTAYDLWEPDTEMIQDPLKCTVCYCKGQCHFKSLFNKSKTLLPEDLSSTLREGGHNFYLIGHNF